MCRLCVFFCLLYLVSFCEKNEKLAKHFLEKLMSFAGNDFKFSVIWQSKKVKHLFKLKDPIIHKANVIYKGTSSLNPDVIYIWRNEAGSRKALEST